MKSVFPDPSPCMNAANAKSNVIAKLTTVAILALWMVFGSAAAGDFSVLYHEPMENLRVLTTKNLYDGQLEKRSGSQTMSFVAFGRAFELDLVDNTRLRSGLSAATKDKLSAYEFLKGEWTGIPGSWARISRIGVDYYGLVWDGEELYAIEPDHELARNSQIPVTVTGTNRIYRWSDTDSTFSDLVLTRDPEKPGDPTAAYQAMVKELGALPMMMPPTQFINVSFVADFEFTTFQGPDVEATMMAVANNVDGIFSDQVGVLINLTETITFAQDNDPFTTTVPGDLLDELAAFRVATPSLLATGATHLLTGRDLDGTVIGFASIASICDANFAVGLTQATSGINTDSVVAAHEFGHNFGAPHDAESGSPCESTPEGSLMSPTVIGSSIFSQCSLDQMQPVIAQASCLQALGPPDIDVTVSPTPLDGFLRETGQIDITLDNIGGGPAFDALLEVTIDPSVDFLLASGADGTCALSPGSAMCGFARINAGTQRVITLDMMGNAVGVYPASYNVDAVGDSDISNNSGAFDFNVAPAVNLVVDAGSDLMVRTGDPVTLQWPASNQEIVDASNVDVFIDWSGGTLVFDSIDISTQGSACAVTSTTSRTCSYAALVAGASEPIDVDFSTSVTGTHVVSLDIMSPDHDNNPADNSDALTIDVFDRLVDLQPAINSPPVTLTVGTPATFSFSGTNNGPDGTQNAIFTVDPGASFTVQVTDSADASCSVQNNTAVCTVAALSVGQLVNFSMTGSANTAATFPLSVIATSGDGDLVPGNNIVTQNVAVVAPPPGGGGGVASGGGGGGGGSTSFFELILLALATLLCGSHRSLQRPETLSLYRSLQTHMHKSRHRERQCKIEHYPHYTQYYDRY